MDNNIIENEIKELKSFIKTANKVYTNKFSKKSLLLKIQTKKTVKNHSHSNKTNVYINISIINTLSKKTKRYRMLMLELRNDENLRIKKYNYDLLNEFLSFTLYKNEIYLILFLIKNIKRIKKIPNKDYSLHYFIVFFIILMILTLIASIYLGELKDIYFNRV